MNLLLISSGNYPLMDKLEKWIESYSINTSITMLLKVLIALAVIALIAFIADYLTKKIILSTLIRFAKKSKTEWDDYLIERRVFHKFAHLAPAIVVYYLIPLALEDISLTYIQAIQTVTSCYMILVGLFTLSAFLDAAHDVYQTLPVAKERAIKGYLQIGKIIAYFFGGIVIFALLIGKDPGGIVVGLGASAAILMFIFKDTILGFVASIQLSANNMVRIGDWIEMPSRKADGNVLEINLTTVKVQNFDRTITTIPTYALVSESFTNWRGMEESDGRRFKRSLLINVSSVKFCSPELIEKFRKIQILKNYIDDKEAELKEYNEKNNIDGSIMVNGRRQTNLGVFRKYVQLYLENHPNVNTDTTLMVRLQEPTERGIPMEIYGFSREKTGVLYEAFLGNVFDHMLAVIPEFELNVFQNPSGDDFKSLISK